MCFFFQPQSAGHLFEPDSLHVFVDHDCHLHVPHFTANKGHFVQGKWNFDKGTLTLKGPSTSFLALNFHHLGAGNLNT